MLSYYIIAVFISIILICSVYKCFTKWKKYDIKAKKGGIGETGKADIKSRKKWKLITLSLSSLVAIPFCIIFLTEISQLVKDWKELSFVAALLLIGERVAKVFKPNLPVVNHKLLLIVLWIVLGFFIWTIVFLLVWDPNSVSVIFKSPAKT